MNKKTININGMICNHCAIEVKKILLSFREIKSAIVHSDIGQAIVETSGELPVEDIAKMLSEKGYELVEIK